jgi:Domain of unknown function (DUF4783)
MRPVFGQISHPLLVWHIFSSFSLKTILMKRLAGWVLAATSLILVSYRSFDNMDAVVSAIREGNVNRLSPFFDSRVDISLPDKADTYSRSQAEMVIGDFFNNNVVQNFKITQQGESGGTFFCAGLLQTRSGNFRTTLFFKQKGDKHYLQEIRFQAVE